MTGELRIKLFAIFILGVAAVYLAFPGDTKPFFKPGEALESFKIVPGIDLAGGAELWVAVDPEGSKGEVPKEQLTQKVVEVLRRRINIRGLKEPRINTHGQGQIQIQLPGSRPEEIAAVKRVIETVGELKFMLVATGRISDLFSDPNKPPPPGYLWLGGRNGEHYLLESAVHMTGDQIESAFAVPSDRGGPAGGWEISFTLKSDGRKKFADLTTKSVDRRLAIVLDKQVQSAPNIETPITQGQGRITGSFKRTDAEELATTLRSGSLPCPIQIVGENRVGASLGQDAILRGVWACGLSFLAVMVFMLFYYRLLGLIACAGVILNVAFLMAIMAMFGATMTLPGLAGIALTFGMAVDSNVLIYERLREEREKGKSLAQAFENGFDRAWTTIIDSNLTTLLSGIVLYYFGTEQVRGFAVTLSIGIATTLITAVTCTKIMLRGLMASGVTEFRMLRMMAEPKIAFLKLARPAAIASVVVIVGGLATLAARWEETQSIEFKGGILTTVRFRETTAIEEVRTLILSVQAGGKPVYDDAEVQAVIRPGEAPGRDFQIRTSRVMSSAAFVKDLHTAFGGRIAAEPVEHDEANKVNLPRDAYDGGTWLIVNLEAPVKLADAEKALKELFPKEALAEPRVTAAGGTPEAATALKIELKAADSGRVAQMAEILARAPGLKLSETPFERFSSIGPTIARDLMANTVWALVISWLLMIIYIWFRFQHWPFGAAAIIALIHDVLVSAGMIAVAGAVIPPTWGVNLDLGTSAMAALLTVIGYSVNDTIVIFDRVRENLKLMRKEPDFSVIIEASVNQTLSRSIITSLTVFLVCVALFGTTARTGGGIASFAWPMLVGVIAGSYSTIYIAGAILAWWYKGRKPEFE